MHPKAQEPGWNNTSFFWPYRVDLKSLYKEELSKENPFYNLAVGFGVFFPYGLLV